MPQSNKITLKKYLNNLIKFAKKDNSYIGHISGWPGTVQHPSPAGRACARLDITKIEKTMEITRNNATTLFFCNFFPSFFTYNKLFKP